MPTNKTPVVQAFLFPVLTRAQVLSETGAQASPYVVSKRIKRWQDHNPVGTNPTYQAYDPSTKSVVTITMTADEAKAINLPGVYDWPKYSVPPTPARILDGDLRDVSAFNVDIICDKAEAQKVADEIGGSLYEEPVVYFPFQVDWKGDARRQWMILWHGKTLRAPALILAKNKDGIGAPGKWDLSGATPVWMSEKAPEGAWSAMPEVPFPITPLADGQTLEETGFGVFDVAIVTPQEAPAPEAPTGGGFTDTDRAILSYIKGTVQVIAGSLKLSV